MKSSFRSRRISQIILNEFENNLKQKRKTNIDIGELIKKSDIYENNIISNRQSIIFFYKTKYALKKKISKDYIDSYNNYNKMIINNILSNKMSRIKEKYIEMLNEIESNDLLIKYLSKKDLIYFLKYLCVVYDKFYIQYPNYIKDYKIYNFMSKYLLKKQKVFDINKENNKYLIIQEKIKKFLSKNSPKDINLFSSDFSENDSKEENFSKIKKMRSQGFDIDVDNSDDSLDKVQSLVKTIDKNLEIQKNEKIYLRARSKSFKNIDTFLIKYSPVKKPKKVKWSEIYTINKNYMRTSKRKKTEVNKDRKNKIIIIEEKKNKKKVKKDKKEKLEIKKKALMSKRKSIDEIKKILLINDVEKNNKILDVVKRGFLFINDNDNENKNTWINKQLLINSYHKTNIKPNKNKINTNNELKIKQKIIQFSQIKNKLNSNNYYNGENYHFFKNRKIIFKNLNDSLNEYRFYNKIMHNSSEKQKFYEKKVIPGLFNIKINGLLQNINNKSNIKNIFPSIGYLTPKHKKYNILHSDTICKKFNKVNNNFLKINITNNSSLLSFTNKKKSIYNVDNSAWENSKILCNKMERLENCIYKYYKTNNEANNKPVSEEKFHFYTINKSEINNSNNKKKNKNIIKKYLKSEYNDNTSKRKIESYFKNNKEELLVLPLNNHHNEKNENDNFSFRDKSISRNTKDFSNNQNAIKIRFYNTFKNKKRHLILSQS